MCGWQYGVIMKKVIMILIKIVLIFVGISTSLSSAQEKNIPSPIIALSEGANAKIKTVRKVAIFLSGSDSLLTKIMEDALAIQLSNTGLTVINRETLEKNVGEQLTKKRKEKLEGAISALEVGTAVNAESILTGIVFIEPNEGKLPSVKIASFQLIAVEDGKTLITLLFESENGKSFSDIAKLFVDILKNNRNE